MPSWHWPETGPQLEQLQTVLAELAYHQDPWLPPGDRLLIVAGTFIAYRRGVAGMGAAGDPAWVGAALFEGSQLIEADGSGLMQTQHWDGTAWSIISTPNPPPGSGLLGVAAVSSGNIWAVGWNGGTTLIEHFTQA